MWIICLYSPVLGFADGALTCTVIVTYHVSDSSACTDFTHMFHTTDVVLKITPIWGNQLRCKSTSTMADVGDGRTDEVMQICQKLWRKKTAAEVPPSSSLIGSLRIGHVMFDKNYILCSLLWLTDNMYFIQIQGCTLRYTQYYRSGLHVLGNPKINDKLCFCICFCKTRWGKQRESLSFLKAWLGSSMMFS